MIRLHRSQFERHCSACLRDERQIPATDVIVQHFPETKRGERNAVGIALCERHSIEALRELLEVASVA